MDGYWVNTGVKRLSFSHSVLIAPGHGTSSHSTWQTWKNNQSDPNASALQRSARLSPGSAFLVSLILLSSRFVLLLNLHHVVCDYRALHTLSHMILPETLGVHQTGIIY